MKKNVIYTLIPIFFMSGMTNLGHTFDLDETVDDEIRKNYNPSQLIQDVGVKNSALEKNIQTNIKLSPEETLPELPTITKQVTKKTTSDVTGTTINKPVVYNFKKCYI